MSVFGVTETRFDAEGVVEEATLRQIDPETHGWVGDPWVVPAHEVADMILKGDRVLPVFMITEVPIPSAEFRPLVLPGGRETIALSESSPGRTLQDLIHNVQDQS